MSGLGFLLGMPFSHRFHWLDVAAIMVVGEIGFMFLWWVWQLAKDACGHGRNLATRP